MSNTHRYIVATIKSWNIYHFHRVTKKLPGDWTLITDQSKLTEQIVHKINPRYIFFPHWSWIVPDEIVKGYECICFHMTDVPYGRGGSPLQNLIVRGHDYTKLTALRMVSELDSGPVYAKRRLCLNGTAADILKRASLLIWDLIPHLIETEPEPVPQTGKVVKFKRRTPSQGALPQDITLEQVYNHIRMLDGEGYPRAYLKYGNLYLEFENAHFESGELTARVIIKTCEE